MQLFSRSADLLFRAALLGAALLVVLSTVVALAVPRSDWWTEVGIRPPQPVPFSHEHHVRGLGLDCRYCHGGVETGAVAGLPPTHTCMTCHSQIWTDAPVLAPVRASLAENRPIAWRRVARLPDYVYFRHDVHVAAGVGCVTCHGRVDAMPLTVRAQALTMQFCLDCHRDPAPRLRPHEAVFDMGWTPPPDARAAGERRMAARGIVPDLITHCAVCHR